jgi:hypothetical protein
MDYNHGMCKIPFLFNRDSALFNKIIFDEFCAGK